MSGSSLVTRELEQLPPNDQLETLDEYEKQSPYIVATIEDKAKPAAYGIFIKEAIVDVIDRTPR